MSQSHNRQNSQDAGVDGIRKRVCKACDRCRLKKSKCDGAHPCSRCKADNAICVFGERKKSHDKVYPKGYVEMLEQQQAQLVAGLQEMYKRLCGANAWTGPSLNEASGHPLTHDILASLNLLDSKHDGSGEVEPFEEDCQKLQSRLIADGAGFVRRRGSFSSESDHSQHSGSNNGDSINSHPAMAASQTPTLSRPPQLFREPFTLSASASPSPLTPQSPGQRQRQTYPPAQSSPLHVSPLSNDPQFYQAEWAIPDMSNPTQTLRSKMALQGPEQDISATALNLFNPSQWDTLSNQCDGFATTSDPLPHLSMGTLHGMHDYSLATDPMDVDFSKFIQVTT